MKVIAYWFLNLIIACALLLIVSGSYLLYEGYEPLRWFNTHLLAWPVLIVASIFFAFVFTSRDMDKIRKEELRKEKELREQARTRRR